LLSLCFLRKRFLIAFRSSVCPDLASAADPRHSLLGARAPAGGLLLAACCVDARSVAALPQKGSGAAGERARRARFSDVVAKRG
jgi:hypothetical protein